jgi:hypothetical protein
MLEPHHLPLRMMIPRGAKNLLVPGRGASGDQTAMSAFRVMAVVAQMGFAAGLAARQCTEHGRELPAIDVPALQAAIEAGGQSLDLSDYGEYLRRDRCVDETVAEADGVSREISGPELRLERNARFVATWRQGGSRFVAERREGRWSVPREAAGGTAGTGAAAGPVRLPLADGLRVELACAEGGLVAALSADGGATWPHRRELAAAVAVDVRPAAVATGTGLAILYVGAGGRLRFWHGSVERIREGESVPHAQRLDAPPEHVEAADAPQA